MAKRVPPSERTSQQIRKMLKEGSATGWIRSESLRLAVRKRIEEALEAEVADVLGREYYERSGQALPDGYRNGYRKGRMKTAETEVEYALPQVSDRDEPYRSEVRDHLRGVTDRLEQLAIEMYARGIDEEGKKHLLHLAPGTKEDTESLRAFLQDMKRRGLRDPLLASFSPEPPQGDPYNQRTSVTRSSLTTLVLYRYSICVP